MIRRLPYVLVALLCFAPGLESSFINYASREVNLKVVYYGAPTTRLLENLQYIYDKTEPAMKGKMISLATETERTVFFDFLPKGVPQIRGFKLRFHLYTTPGSSSNAIRKLILKGVDGVVFIADSDPAQKPANIESWSNLLSNLKEQGYDPESVPIVVQLDNSNHPHAVGADEMKKALGLASQQMVSAVVPQGTGVFDTFNGMAKLILLELQSGAE